MYIYNVTINVQEGVIQQEWLKWMKHEHLPAMLATGKFSKALLTKVMVDEPMGGITFSVQYFTKDKATLNKYLEEDAEDLRAQGSKFSPYIVVFRTELEVVEEIM
ncbi:DUF4286 family protein [Psychroflexus maritimus]|uniref:DUF4286 family protein n=1 Tax=Psychroflexus maritimus TaxID=2714865 RepID=A0A967ACU0_9FLAO|nr:DUF4286 family protein [Psychroflexus maritimus]NGZ89919.1 DUF4286 family protein [Psychroflexus maritimus]